MGDASHRQRIFRLHRALQDIIGGPRDTLAFGWLEDDEVIGRLRVGRGFVYQRFAVPEDDAEFIAAVVEWVHAESPSTS